MDDKIYNYQGRIKTAQKLLRESAMIEANRKNINEYLQFRRANGLSIQRQCKVLYALKMLGEKAGPKLFKDLTKQDMISIVDQVKSSREENNELSYKPSTIRDFMILWRGFIAWTHGIEDPRHEGYPKVVSWMRPKEPRNQLKPSDLITPEEEEKLISACSNLRDRAIVSVQSECGLRPGELLGLRIGDAKIESACVELSVNGKTGSRPVFCIRSMPHITAWLNVHPCRDDPQAYLWGLKGQPNSYAGFRAMLQRTIKKTKIKKKIWAYLLRHSSATDSADGGLSESLLDQAYGWAQGSRSPRTYIHLAGRNVKKAMLQKAGLMAPQQPTRTVKLCPRCQKPIAEKDMSLCPSCGSALNLKSALESKNMSEELETLKKGMLDLNRTLYRMAHSGLELTDGEIDIAIASEKEDLDLLRKNKLTVKVRRDGTFEHDG